MPWPRFVPESVPTLCQLLMAGYGAVYLLSIRRKTRATRWLIAVLTAFATYAGAWFLLTTVPDDSAWSYRFNLLLYVGMVGSLLALVGFGYTFLARPFRREERAAAVAGGVALAALAGWTFFEGVRPDYSRAVLMHQVLGLALIVAALAALATFGRQVRRFRRLADAGPERGARRRAAARAHGAFGALMLVMLGLAVLTFLTAQNVVPFYLFQYAALAGTLATAFGLVVAFLNHTPEPTSAQAKLVGLGLATVLLVLGATALQVLRPGDLATQAGNTIGPAEALRFEPDGQGGYRIRPVPLSLEEPPGAPVRNVESLGAVRLPFAFPFGGAARTTARVAMCPFIAFEGPHNPLAAMSLAAFDGVPRIAPYLHPCAPAGEIGFYYAARSDRAVFSWRTTGFEGGRALSHLTIFPNGAFEMAYRGPRQAPPYGALGFHPGGPAAVRPVPPDRHLIRAVAPGEGLWTDFGAQYRTVAHHQTARLVWIVGAAAAFVLLLFPAFLLGGVLRPLAALTAGVRRLDAGRLDVRVPVRAHDEVGVLARSFNRMAASIQSAQDELRAYAETLEQRVAERTAELEEKSAALERSLVGLQAAQGRLVQQEKLASLGRLTAGIAHEIKNPLNFVNNFAALSVELVDEAEGALAAPDAPRVSEAREALADLRLNAQKIAEHGRRADRIVGAMQLHARGGSGERVEADVAQLLRLAADAALEQHRVQHPGVPVTFEVRLNPDLGQLIVAPEALVQVMMNLLDNAFDAVSAAGVSGGDGAAPHVVLEARRCADDNGRPCVEIRVEDDGPGIPDDVKVRAFEPFFTTKAPGEGIGLGLSLAYEIVTQGHGGTLSLESAPGRGTMVTVTLPAEAA